MDDKIEERDQVDIALIRQQYQKRYTGMIEYLKSEIGEGTEYRNSVARAVVSESGAYFELLDIPEEFGGAASPVVLRNFLTRADALALLSRAVAAIPIARTDISGRLSIMSVYTRRGILDGKGCFIYESGMNPSGDTVERREIGSFRRDEAPQFFKLRIGPEFGSATQLPVGLSFCMATAGDRYLLVTIPLDRGEVTDLNRPAGTTTVH